MVVGQSQNILAGVGADRERNVQSRLRTVCGQLDPVRRLQNTAVHPPLDPWPGGQGRVRRENQAHDTAARVSDEL